MGLIDGLFWGLADSASARKRRRKEQERLNTAKEKFRSGDYSDEDLLLVLADLKKSNEPMEVLKIIDTKGLGHAKGWELDFYHGWALMLSKRPDEARKKFEQSIAELNGSGLVVTEHVEALLYMGLCFRVENRIEEANAYRQKAIELDKRH